MSFTLTNYWILILWVLISGGVLNIAVQKHTELICSGKREVWSIYAALIVAIPYCIWGGYRKNFGDTEVYRESFNEMATGLSGLSSFYKSLTKDKLFYSMEYIIKSVITTKPEIFFLIIATVQVIIVCLIFREYSSDYWFSFIIFIASTDYLSWVCNGSRQFLAVTIIFAATPLLIKKKYIPLILIILFASGFHGSALLMIPVVFIVQGKAFNNKTLLCILASILALFFVGRFTTLLDTLLAETQYTNVVSDWQAWNDDGMNPVRALVYSIPTIIAFAGQRYIHEADDPVVNIAANASVMTTALAIIAVGTSGVFIGRLPIYTSLYANGIMLPWAIDNMFEERSARTIKIIAVLCYIAFFYYQMHVTWSMI